MKGHPKKRYRHMNAEKAREIRRRYFARELNQAELGELFGIARNTVSQIVSGHTWKHA